MTPGEIWVGPVVVQLEMFVNRLAKPLGLIATPIRNATTAKTETTLIVVADIDHSFRLLLGRFYLGLVSRYELLG